MAVSMSKQKFLMLARSFLQNTESRRSIWPFKGSSIRSRITAKKTVLEDR
jgi:hypothetical protein